MNRALEVYDSHDTDKFIILEKEDAAQLLDSILEEWGYDVLKEYFDDYEKRNVFVCIMGSQTTRPDFLHTRTR